MKVHITKYIISEQYLNHTKASNAFYYLDGYLVGLLTTGSITREEYLEYRQWNEDALKRFSIGDNDE